MKSAKKILDWTLNVLTIIVALFLVGMVARRYLAPDPTVAPALRQGAAASLSGVNWAEHGRTLIVAMQVGCHWCEASADFYRDLIAAKSNQFHAVAVLPQPVLESQAFLDSLDVRFADVRQSDIRMLGVSGTPTLILVDREGLIESSWAGKLTPEQETSVFKKLGIKRISAGPASKAPKKAGSLESDLLTGEELHRLTQAQRFVPVVDIRPREEFKKGHISGSLNIPLDELEARAMHEAPRSVPVVIYCGYYAACETKLKSQGIPSYCSLGHMVLAKQGFSRIRMLKENLEQIEQAGVQVLRVPEIVAEKALAQRTMR